MNQWMTLFNKELLEMTRNYKWIWVPITFILLGVMDPLTSYYMPQIIEAVGGLPEGTKIEMPKPTASAVLIMSMGEYQTVGVLIIVLSMMGSIAGERKSGVAQLILVKPVSYLSYITSKWVSALILFVISLFLGLLASWYYTGVLFEYLPIGSLASAFVIYGLWLALVVTLVIFFSAVVKHPGIAGTVSLAVVFIFSMIAGSFAHLLEWSPTQLFTYASETLVTDRIPELAWPAVGLTVFMIIVLLSAAVILFKRKELAD
jgi:ABC-2 type transport system permease protein